MNALYSTASPVAAPVFRRVGLAAIFAVLFATSGCIVNTAPRTGMLEVRWEVSTCTSQGIGTVEVNLLRSGITEGSSGPVLCTKGRLPRSRRPTKRVAACARR